MTDSRSAALFLIGHGTRSATGVDQLVSFARAVAEHRPGVPVGRGFIELVEPDLQNGMDELIAAGATQIVGVPLVLLGAGHMKDDGPAALAEARRRQPGVSTIYARELGVHPLVLEVASERIDQAAPHQADAVVVVGRGSTDPDANADLSKAVRLLADNRGIGTAMGVDRPLKPDGQWGSDQLGLVEPAFVSLAAPTVASALDKVFRLGARRITVAPYFLFSGILIDRIRDQATKWALSHPDASLSFAAEFGPDHRLVELVWERYDEALGSAVVMNCDCCIYRAPLPGYEERVGAPPFG